MNILTQLRKAIRACFADRGQPSDLHSRDRYAVAEKYRHKHPGNHAGQGAGKPENTNGKP